MVIVDAEIAQVAIGGQFRATDLETFLAGLQRIANVEVERPPGDGFATEPLRLRARHTATVSPRRAPAASL
jgi:ferric-dicitrate binding protein FerR (iron transport regulator)